jgi:hypothetical protein
MTGRHAGYLVTLTTDIREDDAQEIIAALRMIKGVAGVQPLVSDWQTGVAADRRDHVWAEALYELARNGPGEGTP